MKITHLALLACILPILSGCGKAVGSGPVVTVVAAPLSGYTCFAIQNAAGETVGGSCVKD